MTRSLTLPVVVDRDVATAIGAELERAKVLHVLLTEPGELPWRTSFGTALEVLRHRPMDAVQVELARLRCRDALATWLPGVDAEVVAGRGEAAAIVLKIQLGAEVVEVER